MQVWYQILINKIDDYHLYIKKCNNSFANEKSNSNDNWLVDRQDYLSHFYDKIFTATEKILIAGRWVSLEFYLKRVLRWKNNIV